MVQVGAVLICSSSRATFATKIHSKVFVPLESIFSWSCALIRYLPCCQESFPQHNQNLQNPWPRIKVIKTTGTIHCKASFSVGHFLTRKWTQSLPGSTATLTHLDVPNKMTCFDSFRSLPHLRSDCEKYPTKLLSVIYELLLYILHRLTW